MEDQLRELEALATRMQAVFGGATERRPDDNAYDWAKRIRVIVERIREESAQ